MINRQVKVKVEGQFRKIGAARWTCVKCGRDFKLPKVPKTCEDMFSICMTCFAISCSELPLDDDESFA